MSETLLILFPEEIFRAMTAGRSIRSSRLLVAITSSRSRNENKWSFIFSNGWRFFSAVLAREEISSLFQYSFTGQPTPLWGISPFYCFYENGRSHQVFDSSKKAGLFSAFCSLVFLDFLKVGQFSIIS